MNSSDSELFLTALGGQWVSKREPLILCAFAGDPGENSPTMWRPKPWYPGLPLPPTEANGYVTVSTFKIADDGTWRRQVRYYKRGLTFFVDDVGTKIDPDLVKGITPSAKIETSPGNWQYYYFLGELASRDEFDRTIKAFIHKKLLGSDSGMNGVNRVGRIPGYLNMKPKHNNFQVRMTELNPDLRYSIREIQKAFGISKFAKTFKKERPQTYNKIQSIYAEDFKHHLQMLRRLRLVKRDKFNAGMWTEITCPWLDNHTDKANSGAAISAPGPDNGYVGGFRCHHGHCEGKDWNDLTQYLSEIAAENLERINEHYGRRNKNTSERAAG